MLNRRRAALSILFGICRNHRDRGYRVYACKVAPGEAQWTYEPAWDSNADDTPIHRDWFSPPPPHAFNEPPNSYDILRLVRLSGRRPSLFRPYDIHGAARRGPAMGHQQVRCRATGWPLPAFESRMLTPPQDDPVRIGTLWVLWHWAGRRVALVLGSLADNICTALSELAAASSSTPCSSLSWPQSRRYRSRTHAAGFGSGKESAQSAGTRSPASLSAPSAAEQPPVRT